MSGLLLIFDREFSFCYTISVIELSSKEVSMRLLSLFQVIVAFLLIVSILLQSRGSDMGAATSGTANYYAKRGFEKFLLYASATLAALFVLLAGVNVWLSQHI